MGIRSEELRIGNLVLALGWDEDSGGNIVGDPNGNEIEVADIDLLKYIQENKSITKWEGIPLTEEWLIKMGFEFRQLYDAVFSYQVEVKDSEFRIFCVDLKEGQDYHMSYDGNDVVIKYVHQLQNLYFALTGKELSIN